MERGRSPNVDMTRREFALVTALMAFLLAFFPWLRTDEGVEVAREGAKHLVERMRFKGGTFMITMGIRGYEIPDEVLWELQR